MTSTTFSPNEASKIGEMTQSWSDQGRRIPTWDERACQLMAGPVGLISNADDMVCPSLFHISCTHTFMIICQAKWLKLLLNSGTHVDSNSTIISRTTFDAMTTAYRIVNGKTAEGSTSSIVGYGMGWFRQSYSGREVSHDVGFPISLNDAEDTCDARLYRITVSCQDSLLYYRCSPPKGLGPLYCFPH